MMLPVATDWATISSLATAGGTLVLAVATFAAVRSSNHSARIAEVALQDQRRPVLAPSRFNDPVQKIMFIERKWVRARGGHAVADHENSNVYLAISLRNVSSGIGVCQGWAASGGFHTSGTAPAHRPEEHFHMQVRDLCVPAGDTGMWQGALRDPSDPDFESVATAIEAGEPITIELLYSDHVGGQRTITRFGLTPYTDPDEGEQRWLANISRHWYLDRAGPRSEGDLQAQAESIARRIEAATAEAEAGETASPAPTT